MRSKRKRRNQTTRNNSQSPKITILTRIREHSIQVTNLKKSTKEDLTSLNLEEIRATPITKEDFRTSNRDSIRAIILTREDSRIKEDSKRKEDSRIREERISIIKSSKNKIYKILLLIF